MSAERRDPQTGREIEAPDAIVRVNLSFAILGSIANHVGRFPRIPLARQAKS